MSDDPRREGEADDSVDGPAGDPDVPPISLEAIKRLRAQQDEQDGV